MLNYRGKTNKLLGRRGLPSANASLRESGQVRLTTGQCPISAALRVSEALSESCQKASTIPLDWSLFPKLICMITTPHATEQFHNDR